MHVQHGAISGSGLVGQVADVSGGVAADTLEGPWDELAVGLSGDLILLKGARSLTIGYRLSGTNLSGAIRLARPALEQLAAAPDPARRAASIRPAVRRQSR